MEAVRGAPGDDAPRLVYADWLEEQGDPLGRFIRVQCELAKLSDSDARRAELLLEQKRAQRGNTKHWRGSPPSTFKFARFIRGFPHLRLRCNPRLIMRHQARLADGLGCWHFLLATAVLATDEDRIAFCQFLTCNLMPFVASLSIVSMTRASGEPGWWEEVPLREDALQALRASPYLRRLEHLFVPQVDTARVLETLRPVLGDEACCRVVRNAD
jgi:uncharacterized protein (TIGR02996 family)